MARIGERRGGALAEAAIGQGLFWALAVSGFVLALLFVWLQTQQVRYGYRLAAMQSQYRIETDLMRKLELSWEQWTAPQRLAELARERLHLAPAAADRILYVSEDGR